MKTYPTFLFIEIILDRGCKQLRTDPDNPTVLVFEGLKGSRFFIDTEEEDITDIHGHHLLSQAGLEDLFQDIFPPN